MEGSGPVGSRFPATEPVTEWRPGDVVDGYELVGQAPVDFTGRGARRVEGAWYQGSWSDPWWGYSPRLGWGLVRWWKPARCHVPSVGDWPGPVPAGAIVTPWPLTEGDGKPGQSTLPPGRGARNPRAETRER